jgi:Raf kinase inhibitor-like YbhB/YbcL family protein
VYYDIPPDIGGLPENVSTQDKPAIGGTQGINDFRRKGYGGPCPPGGTHRYFFKLYALDIKLNLKAGANKQQLLAAMQGHVRTEAELMGKYRR